MKKRHQKNSSKTLLKTRQRRSIKRFFQNRTNFIPPAATKNSIDHIHRLDAHVHTCFSDGSATVKQVEEACLKLKTGCLITDHNEIRGSLALFDRKNIPTIPSMEIGSREQIELLLFFRHAYQAEDFFKNYIEPFRRKCRYSFLPLSLDYLSDAASEYDTIVSIPHPFAPFWKNIEYGKKRRDVIIRTLQRVDGIEVYNGTATHRANRKSMMLCQTLGAIPLAGSDSHSVKTIGSAGIDFFHPVTSNNLFDSIRNNHICHIFEHETRHRHVSNTYHLAVNHSKNFVLKQDFLLQIWQKNILQKHWKLR